MSDLENVNARTQAAPITAFATGKLGSIGGKGSLFAQTDGLVDAFAEVFASIAASDVQASTTDQLVAPSEGQELSSDETAESTEPVAGESDDDQDVRVDQVILAETQQETVRSDAVESNDDIEHKQRVEVELEEEQEIETQVVVVETTEKVNTNEENARPELLTREQNLQADTQHESTDRRRYTETIQPVVQADENLPDGDVIKQTDENRIEAESLTQEDALGSESDDQAPVVDTQDDPRRSRRRRDRHDRSDQKQPIESTNSNSSDAAVKPKAATQGNSIADALSRVAGVESSEQSKPVAKTAIPTVSHASAQSSAARVDSASGSQAARGARVQTPQGLEGIREESRARPEAAAKPAKTKRNAAAETVSRVKLIQRVSKAFQHLGAEGGMIRLRLAPGDMGSVRVEMKVQNRNVQARVVAETEAASSSLREHLPDLKARLESFGMQVEKIEIEVESESEQQSSFFNHDTEGQRDKASDQWRQQGQRNSRPSRAESEIASPSVSPAVAPNAEFATVGVDIRL